MNPIRIRYDLDRTGTSIDNLVLAEPHTLSQRQIRPFAPLNGPFYTDSVKIRDALTGQELVRGQDWKPSELYTVATLELAQAVHALILITNPQVSNKIEIDYQVVGGEFSYNNYAIVQMINNLQLDNRPTSWPSIIDKPSAFNPASHFHDPGDTYGWEYTVQALYRIEEAILMGDRASHDEILAYVDTQIAAVNASLDQLRTSFNAHAANTSNPHQVTKAQVGLGAVLNYGTANNTQTAAGTATNLYVTPAGLAYAVAQMVGNSLTAHINNTSNPHQVTKAQVGLSLVDNFATANLQQAAAGVANNLFVTPAGVAAFVATSPLANVVSSHVANKSNPHEVTKAQVGLGLVNNYGTADNPQTVTGVATNLYVTPAGLQASLNTNVLTPMNAHISDKGNPHEVTAAQVGTLTEAQIRTLVNTTLPLDGSREMTGPLIGHRSSMGMVTGNWNNGSFVARAGATGDGNLAGISFHHDSYLIKAGVRNDGTWGVGGGSSSPWRLYSNTNGDLVAAGDVRAYSDPRLKENMRDMDVIDTVERIRRLSAKNFTWRPIAHVMNKAGKEDFGLDADAVQKQFAQAVDYGIELDGQQYKTVAYAKLVAPLITTVNHLFDKLEQLQSEVDELKA